MLLRTVFPPGGPFGPTGPRPPRGLCESERVIRSADPARDAAACAAIYAPYVLDSPATFDEQPPGAAVFAQRIEQLSATHGFLVAERDGQVAGYASAGPHRPRRAYRWSADVSVYVAAGFQRSGVGRELYTALLPQLREHGYRTACAGITLPNAGSVGLHESFGFEQIGLFKGIGWKAGAWCDVGWWQLQLAPQDDGDGAPPAEPLSA